MRRKRLLHEKAIIELKIHAKKETKIMIITFAENTKSYHYDYNFYLKLKYFKVQLQKKSTYNRSTFLDRINILDQKKPNFFLL